jgi:hypothetical protein
VRRKLLILAALSMLALPAAAAAGTTATKISAGASTRCTVLKAQLGATSFYEAFTSFGSCVSRIAPLELKNTSAAAAACAAERADAGFAAAHHGKSFARFYGRNALPACVALKARASSGAERTGAPNPARTCTALQGSLGANDFAKSYGSYATCLSWVAQNAINAQIAATSTCQAMPGDPGFAAGHKGKTFAQWYGTPGTWSDAFGNCVIANAVLPLAQGTGAQPVPDPNPNPGCGGPRTLGVPQPMMCTVAGAN